MSVLTIELPDKLYERITIYCEENQQSVEDFAFDAVVDKFNTELHEDLNKRFEVKEDNKSIENKSKIESVNTKEVTKNDKTTVSDELKPSQKVVATETNNIKKTDSTEKTTPVKKVEKEIKPVKNKRTIKAK